MAAHAEVLDSTINTLIDSSASVTKSLEQRVAELITQGDTSRNSIIGAYQTTADAYTSDVSVLNAVVANTVENQTEAGIGGGFVPEDYSTQDLLVEDARGTLRENIMNHAETVTGLVVAGAVTGLATDQLVKTARGAVSGVMMSTSDPVTTRLQASLAKMATDPNKDPKAFAELRKQISDRLPGIATAGSLSDTLRGVAESVVMRFDGAFTANRAKRNAIQRYQYVGGTVANTRPWCQGLDGEILDEDTINSMWTESWQGKSGSNPFVDRGGYNCRHFWEPVVDE